VSVRDIKLGADIEAESFRIIDAEASEPRPFDALQWQVVRRMIHTTADFEMLALTRFHPLAMEAGVAALARGCRLFTDTEMARAGIPERRMSRLGCSVDCLMRAPEVMELSQAQGITRARAAIDYAVERLRPDIYVIGNAPTALLRLLEHIDAGRARPVLVVGMPVGFVNAAESKDLLMAQDAVPYIAVAGRKGGSALAASAVNALAEIALRRKEEA
jgi:precorrin-8X/cobalt-precorrin-8 methylmutase